MFRKETRGTSWIAYRGWLQIVLLFAVAGWWAWWDFESGGSSVSPLLARHLIWIDIAFAMPLLFFGPPVATIAAIQLICYLLDRTFLGRTWKISDLVRLTFWRTVSPTFALLLVATGFEALYERRLGGVMWLLFAAMVAMVGTGRLRSAEGLKLQPVKSGELYKRAFVLAKEMSTNLRQVYIVPAGRGHLTNAYGLSQSIAVTDNYGKFLNRAQLDFVIGHELGHVRARHGRKRLLLVLAIFTGAILLSLGVAPASAPVRSLVDISVVLVPILGFYSLSRHFEYAADKAGVELTNEPEAAIRALARLYRTTQAPTHSDWFTELFMTHPSLVHRASAIGKIGFLSTEQVSEVIAESSGRT